MRKTEILRLSIRQPVAVGMSSDSALLRPPKARVLCSAIAELAVQLTPTVRHLRKGQLVET